jgi:hypothetical protein
VTSASRGKRGNKSRELVAYNLMVADYQPMLCGSLMVKGQADVERERLERIESVLRRICAGCVMPASAYDSEREQCVIAMPWCNGDINSTVVTATCRECSLVL